MKRKIHPISYKILCNCICKNKFYIMSTIKKNITLDVCNLCHPFNSKKHKINKNINKINKFNIE